LFHQFPDAVVIGLVVDKVVSVVLVAEEVAIIVDVEDWVMVDVSIEVFVEQDAKTSDITSEHVKAIHAIPLFIRSSYYLIENLR
jgi:hypothetical protein